MMQQGKLDFKAPIVERITPAKGSIYPFSKHTTDWAFIAFLERVNDRWDSDVPDEEQQVEEAPEGEEEPQAEATAVDEQTAIINAMLKAQEERLSQIAQGSSNGHKKRRGRG